MGTTNQSDTCVYLNCWARFGKRCFCPVFTHHSPRRPLPYCPTPQRTSCSWLLSLCPVLSPPCPWRASLEAWRSPGSATSPAGSFAPLGLSFCRVKWEPSQSPCTLQGSAAGGVLCIPSPSPGAQAWRLFTGRPGVEDLAHLPVLAPAPPPAGGPGQAGDPAGQQ